MSSLVKRSGKWSLQFLDKQKKQRTMALDTASERDAQRLKIKVNNPVWSVKNSVPPDGETAKWLMDLQGTMAAKLVELGLAVD